MNTQANWAMYAIDLLSMHAQEQITQALTTQGIVTFDTISSPKELVQFCTRLGTIIKHRDSDELGLTRIIQYNKGLPAGYQTFSTSHLSLHTDGSSMPEPATLVVLWCLQPAQKGGLTLLVDGKQVYEILAQKFPKVLSALTTPNSGIFAGSYPPFYGSIFSASPNGNICIRFRYDNLGYYTAPVCSILPTFLKILKQQTVSFSLQQYQGYIIQNGRWLHGRTAYFGDRELYRVLIRTSDEMDMGKQVCLGFQLT